MEVNGQPQALSADGSFRFLGLGPGHHVLSVAASSDGVRWSEAPAVVAFDVDWPLWLQWWALLLYLAGLGGVGLTVYQARAAHRAVLERQRARIALDLHDEVGSGLGSIGLIAGAMVRNAVGNSVAAATIAETTAELGIALTDIVWALRPESERPEALMAFLAQRGSRLCAGPDLRLEVVRPDPWPRAPLSLPVRRNLSAIALEAIHNAAKYSEASTVVLGLEEGKRWRLWIHDDGVGIDPTRSARPGGGSGIDGMRSRAAEIGAELTLESGSEGTRIEVRFRPDAADRRIR